MHRYCVQSFQDIDDTQCITNSGLVLCFALYLSSFRLAFFRLVVFSPGVFSIFRLFAWRRFVISSFCLASFCYFIISLKAFRYFNLFARRLFVISAFCMTFFRLALWRKDETTPGKTTKNATQKDEITPREKTKNKSFKWRYFAWCFRLFALVFRLFAWQISLFRSLDRRFFVFSLFRVAYFAYSPHHNARRKRRNNEMAQISHHRNHFTN